MGSSAAAEERLFEEGRCAWPGVEIAPDVFAAFVRERAPDDASLASLHVADLYLACACTAGNPRALEAFEGRYVSQVPLFLAGVERSSSVIDEVCQLVRERLFVAGPEKPKKISDYSGRGSLTSWLRVVTLRVASNRRRSDNAHASYEDEMGAADLLPTADPELAIVRTRYGGAFSEALRRAFADLSPRERLLLRMHFLDGLNLDRMGLVFSVHRATVARWLAAAREAVLEKTMTLLGDQLRLDAAEFASLFRAVRSGLDVSLHGLLLEPGGAGG